LDMGVQDYLVKDEFDAHGLARAMRHALARAAAKQALWRSEARYRVLFEKARDGVILCDRNGRIQAANQAALEIFGYTMEELLGMSRGLLLHPEERRRFNAFFLRVLRDDSQPGEHVCLRKDGSEILVWTDGQLVNDHMVQFVLRDVTEARRQEEKVRLLTRAIEQSEQTVMITDVRGRIEYVNPYFTKLTGYSAGEALGRNPRLLKSGRHPLRFYAEMWAELTAGKTWRGMLRNRKKNGEHYWEQVIISPVVDEPGRITHFVAVKSNMTELKRAERVLRETNIQLDEALARAEAATQAKSAFLANMSHEIRTSLNGVIGMAGLLLTTDLDPTQRRFAETLRSSGETLLGLINDILDFSKIEAGRMELELAPFDLRAELDDCMALLAWKAEEKGLELSCHALSGVPDRLVGDPGRLRQILTNLVGNALKFTEQGKVEVKVQIMEDNAGMLEYWNAGIAEAGGASGVSDAVETTRTSESIVLETQSFQHGSDPGVSASRHSNIPESRHSGVTKISLLFTVRDTGIGIPQDAVGRLFQGFSQVDASINRKYGGTGLGLAICRQLVELMGGEIGVESRPGEGSTFWFTVVLEKAADQTENLDREVGQARNRYSLPDFSHVKARILVVEDNSANQLLILSLLQRMGLDADVATNGAEAVSAAGQAPYDLILMDVRMPVMDGLQATREIRGAEEQQRVPIIALTAHADLEARDACIQAGMDDFLTKPVDVRKLTRILGGWLASELSARDRNPSQNPPGSHPLPESSDPPGNGQTAAPRDGGVIFDKQGLLSRVEEDEDLAGHLLTLFQNESPLLHGALMEAVCRQDGPEVRNIAHSIKGMAATVGARQVFKTAEVLEQAAMSVESKAIARLGKELDREMQRFLDVLEQEEV
jgi:PAS domain S-box-containing protein